MTAVRAVSAGLALLALAATAAFATTDLDLALAEHPYPLPDAGPDQVLIRNATDRKSVV